MEKKIDKIIIYGVLSIIPCTLILYFVITILTGPSTQELIRERDSLKTVNGVVDSLYFDTRNHNVKTALLKGGSLYAVTPQWETKIDNGDSLSKKQGSFFLEIFKPKGKKIQLDYRSTYLKP